MFLSFLQLVLFYSSWTICCASLSYLSGLTCVRPCVGCPGSLGWWPVSTWEDGCGKREVLRQLRIFAYHFVHQWLVLDCTSSGLPQYVEVSTWFRIHLNLIWMPLEHNAYDGTGTLEDHNVSNSVYSDSIPIHVVPTILIWQVRVIAYALLDGEWRQSNIVKQTLNITMSWLWLWHIIEMEYLCICIIEHINTLHRTVINFWANDNWMFKSWTLLY